MSDHPLEQTLSIAQHYLDSISQELNQPSHAEDAVDLLLNTLREGFDKKLQEKPEMLLQQLDQLEKIIDVELMHSTQKH